MISIIIPTYNEAGHIGPTISHLFVNGDSSLIKEVIVSDGGSNDDTVREAGTAGAKVIISPRKGRAAQMNAGAMQASAPVLYFLHADSIPPHGFTRDIIIAWQKGYASGCYRLAFDYKHWFLKANCWFTRFDVNAFRFGDQSLFVTREVFMKAGGFCERHIVMEDQEIIKRIRKYASFKVMGKSVVTSARKYRDNGIYRMQGIFFLIYFMYHLGYSQERLLVTFKRLIKQNKL